MVNPDQTTNVPDSFGETWEITPQLRWISREFTLQDAFEPAFSHNYTATILQQKWRCLETGREEWRDVMTESESP